MTNGHSSMKIDKQWTLMLDGLFSHKNEPLKPGLLVHSKVVLNSAYVIGIIIAVDIQKEEITVLWSK